MGRGYVLDGPGIRFGFPRSELLPSTYSMPGTLLSNLHVLIHLPQQRHQADTTVMPTLQVRKLRQRGYVTCSKSQSL